MINSYSLNKWSLFTRSMMDRSLRTGSPNAAGRSNRARREGEDVSKVKTLQVGNKLFIFDGKGPLRYVDLKANKLHIFMGRKR